MEYTKHVLDKGFVELVDYLGEDLTVVNSARVSFGKRKEELDDKDIKLMKYLYKNEHHSPYRHQQVQLHIKCPEVVARQLIKHIVGIQLTSNQRTTDMGFNEISRRYVEIDEFYIPHTFRKQSSSSKQASQCDDDGNPLTFTDSENSEFNELWNSTLTTIQDSIAQLIEKGVAKEQAQALLPICFYTEFYMTASFQSLAHFCDLRIDSHAQWEIKQYALAIKEVLELLFPETSNVWFNS